MIFKEEKINDARAFSLIYIHCKITREIELGTHNQLGIAEDLVSVSLIFTM